VHCILLLDSFLQQSSEVFYKFYYIYTWHMGVSVFIARQHTDARYWCSKYVRPSVCPSVRPFIMFRYQMKQLNISSQFFHHTAQSFFFYQHQTSSRHSDGVTPCRGAKYRWGIKISLFSSNKSLYLTNDARYRRSYYGRWIGTRMWSVGWCHFQWPWTNPNPVFKVTSLFDAKYLTNGYRYGHSYYRRRIGNRT